MPLVGRFTLDSIVRLLSLVLVTLAAVALGRLTWILIEPSSILPPAAEASLAVAAEGTDLNQRGGFRELASLNVFGSATPLQSKTRDAPDTSLSWSLKGVLSDPDPSRSAAILLPQGKKEKLYRVGADLPGNITLQEVLADRVILNRSGRLETLRLKRTTTGDATASGRAAALPAGASGANAAPRVDRDAWINNPQRFLDVITAKPVMEGGVLYGLEISPARNAREFEAAGLQPGDVITEVDGSPVSEITDYRDMLKSLADASSVFVALERDGEPMNITINMD